MGDLPHLGRWLPASHRHLRQAQCSVDAIVLELGPDVIDSVGIEALNAMRLPHHTDVMLARFLRDHHSGIPARVRLILLEVGTRRDRALECAGASDAGMDRPAVPRACRADQPSDFSFRDSIYSEAVDGGDTGGLHHEYRLEPLAAEPWEPMSFHHNVILGDHRREPGSEQRRRAGSLRYAHEEPSIVGTLLRLQRSLSSR